MLPSDIDHRCTIRNLSAYDTFTRSILGEVPSPTFEKQPSVPGEATRLPRQNRFGFARAGREGGACCAGAGSRSHAQLLDDLRRGRQPGRRGRSAELIPQPSRDDIVTGVGRGDQRLRPEVAAVRVERARTDADRRIAHEPVAIAEVDGGMALVT